MGLIGMWTAGVLPASLFHAKEAALPKLAYVSMPEILTNLAGNEGEEPYIKLKVAIELPAKANKMDIINKIPQLVDMFQTYVRSMHPAELQGAVGTYRLKEALLSRANIIVAPEVVNDILFEELIVQ